MRKTLTTILLFCIISISYSQVTDVEKNIKTQVVDTVEGWKIGGTTSINLTQISLKNWSAGGQNSISITGLVNLFARFKKNNTLWENYLDLGYGTIDDDEKDWWKTDDKVDFTSKYGYKASNNWYYAALINMKTQMTAGYDYPDDSTKISGFLSPGYIVSAIGFDYKPSKDFTVFIAPFTSKMTIVKSQSLADNGAFGMEPAEKDSNGNITKRGEWFRNEVGGYIRMFYKKELMKNVGLQTKLDLFSNYQTNPENIDLSWEVLISMKVNKYISATITTHLLYDDDIDFMKDDGSKEGAKIQFKEVLGVGFLYKF